jgi:hypothetical protein
VLSASLPAGQGQPVVTNCRNGTATVPCVQDLDLNIRPGHSVTLTMSVQAPPACSNAAVTWGAAARSDKQIATLGVGNLTLESEKSSLAMAVDDSCHLQYQTQPHSVNVGQTITGTDYDQTGSPVSVEVLDANDALVTSSTAAVTVALVSNPGSATLGGTTTQNAAGGVATFSDLTLDQPGTGYTLGASSTGGISPVTSAPFDAQNAGTQCAGSTCTVTASNTQGGTQVTATGPGGTSGELTDSFNVPGEPPVTCGSYVSADPNTYDILTTNPNLSKVVTITITDPQGVLPPANRVLGTQQICLQAPYDFIVNGGGMAVQSTLPDGTTVYTGLLPGCADPNSGPCHNRPQDSTPADPSSPTGYDIVLVADLPAAPGDPRMN